MPKTKLELQTEINIQLNELRIKKFSGVYKAHHTDLELLTDIIKEFYEYKTGIIRTGDVNDKLLDDIITISKWAFINSHPGINEDIKIKCQRILDIIGGY